VGWFSRAIAEFGIGDAVEDLTEEKSVLGLKSSVKWREWLKRRLDNALMKAMNAIGHRRREAVEYGASSAASGIGLCMAAAGFARSAPSLQRRNFGCRGNAEEMFGLSRSFALPFDGKDRRKDLISRRLRQKQAFFGPFLSRKGVDFSPVMEKAAFFYFPIFGAVAMSTKFSWKPK
jgi:hypothetical protein